MGFVANIPLIAGAVLTSFVNLKEHYHLYHGFWWWCAHSCLSALTFLCGPQVMLKVMQKLFKRGLRLLRIELYCICLTSEFTIKKGPRQWEAKVFSENKKEVAEIKKTGEKKRGEYLEFRLLSKKDNHEWVVTNKIDGEHRRFSLSVREADKQEEGRREKDSLLTVRDNIFKHNGKFYMLANHPEGKSWHDYVNNPVRYISRLDNFPYSDASEMDENKHHQNLRQKLKRFRGVPVGEASGLGTTPEGHHVKVNDELDDIGLFLAATSYLMYASA
jgi:hypothetical protein